MRVQRWATAPVFAEILKVMQWFAVVCGGLPASSLFSLLAYLLTCLVCLRRRTRSITNDRSPGWSVLRCCHGITQGQLGVVDDLVSPASQILVVICGGLR